MPHGERHGGQLGHKAHLYRQQSLELPAKPIAQKFVSPLGHVIAPAVPDADKGRQAPDLTWVGVEIGRKTEQLFGLLIWQAFDELKELLLAGHETEYYRMAPLSDPRSSPHASKDVPEFKIDNMALARTATSPDRVAHDTPTFAVGLKMSGVSTTMAT